MKTELIDISPTHKQLVLEVPSSVVEEEIARVARRYTRTVRIPGFRPGKAPERVVRRRYREQILSDAVQDLIPRTLDEVLRERALDPIAEPDIRDVRVEEGQPLTFTAEFEVLPPVDPIDYDTITLRRTPIEVSAEAVDRAIDRLRERNARIEPVEDRPAAHGDLLTADVVRSVRRRPGGTADEAPETLADATIEIGAPANPPGFDAEVIGMQAGETRAFEVTFPDDYGVETLAGATVAYSVTVKAIKRRVLPAVDDEFARDLEFESIEALRARVTDDLRREAERAQAQELRSDLLRQLAARVPFDVPDTLVRREIDRRLRTLAEDLVGHGIDPRHVNLDWREFGERQRESAVTAVKGMIVLDDVARREGIAVTPEELDAELARVARRAGRSAADVRARLEAEGGLERLATGLRRDKTVEFLLSRVTILEA
jgi:trigger factor